MNRILFPIDFSDVSDNAFLYALEMAKTFNSELILLHTFSLPIVDTQAMPINYAMIYDSVELANFDHFKEKIPKLREIAEKHRAGKVVLNHILMDGDLIYSIKKVIKQENIDFVIMGTNGASGWFETLMGTNTSSVISEVSVPVMSIPIDAKFSKIKSIAFTTRFRDKDIETMIKLLVFAKKIKALVKCLYVKTPYSDVSETTVNNWKKRFECETDLQFFIVPNSNVKETIEDFLTEQDIDLLVMVTYKRNFFLELFTNSTTQKLSFYLKTPILAFHN